MKTLIHRMCISAAALLAVAGARSAALADPDPTVSLVLEKSNPGFETTLQPGDRLTWYVELGNEGDATALGVTARVSIPKGLRFVIGSLVNVDPRTTTVQFSRDGGDTWDYSPVGAPGDGDAAVTDLRFVRTSLAPHPGGVFSVTDEASFGAGAYDHTWYDEALGVRLNLLDFPAGVAPTGTYTTPVFPLAIEQPVRAWKTLHVDQTVVPGQGEITYDVLDGATGLPIVGFTGLVPGANGNINVSGISAAEHTTLAVRANLSAQASDECLSVIADQTDPAATCTPDPLGVTSGNVVFGNLWRSGRGCKQRGFRWTVADQMQILKSLHGDDFEAFVFDMNDSDVAVGESLTQVRLITHAVLWPAGSVTPIDLQGGLGDATVSSWATAVNASGTVAGMLGGGLVGPFRWSAGTGMVPATAVIPQGADWDWRALINARGDIAGRYKPYQAKTWHAYVWTAAGQFIDLQAPGDVRYVTGINASGMVTGKGDLASDGWVYIPGQGTVELAKAQGATGRFYVANGVDDAGKVVGSYVDAADHRRPFAWTESGGIVALETAGWAMGEALGVTRAGTVLVSAYDKDRLTAPYARIGYNQGGTATTLMTLGGPLPEIHSTREAMNGYHTFNDAQRVTGYFVPRDRWVRGEPAEVPYFSGPCGSGAPALAGVTVTFEGKGVITTAFQTIFAGDICSGDNVGRVALSSTTPDANLGNNIASAPLWLGKPDLGVTVTTDKGIAAYEFVTWSVTVTNLGLTPVSGATVWLELPYDGSLAWYSGKLALATDLALQPGESATLTYFDYVQTNDPSVEIVARATVTSPLDCVTDNDADTVSVRAGYGPNLYVTSVASPVVTTGGTLTYVVTFGNNGNDVFAGQAILSAGIADLVLKSAAMAYDPTGGFDFTPGATRATFLVDGTANPVYPGAYWTMTLTVQAPPCVLMTSGLVTSQAAWGPTMVADQNPTDDASAARTLVAGQPTDDPTLCAPTCQTDADCPIVDAVCNGTAVCFPTLGGCVYNEVPLNADTDGLFCTVNERCVNGALVTDQRTCTQSCDASIGATCDPKKDACVDLYPPGSYDQDGDGVPQQCDVCDQDFYNCSAPLTAVYAVVQDAQGKPAGTIRCSRNEQTGELACETKLDGNGQPTDELKIYPDLVCAP